MNEELNEFIELMNISEDDAMKALLTAFPPTDPGALRAAWKQKNIYDNNAPSTKDIWDLYVKNDFRCVICGGQRRITLDHIDGDKTNHTVHNLRVLCFDCNRANSTRGVKNKDHRLRIYRTAMQLFKMRGVFPTKNQVSKASGIKNLSGATYMLDYLKQRLENAPLL